MKCGRCRKGRNKEGGFSLVEAVVGMLIFGITVLALYGGIMSGYSTMRMARENLRAIQIILDKMEMIRLYSFDQVVPGFLPATFTVLDAGPMALAGKKDGTTPTGVTYTGTVTVSSPGYGTNYDPNMKVVRVQVSWNTGGVTHQREISTTVTYDGLYSYVF